MTQTQSDESLEVKSSTSSAGSLPLLDLYNCLTLVADILAEPGGRDARRYAGQIIRDCQTESGGEIAPETQRIIDFAERCRSKEISAEERYQVATELLDYLNGLIEIRVAALAEGTLIEEGRGQWQTD